MLGKYDVHMDSEIVGCAEVIRTGLFYLINCSCEQKEKGEYKIVVFCESNRVELGYCTLNETRYKLVRQIPIKNVGVGQMRFVLERNDSTEKFIAFDNVQSEFPLNILPVAILAEKDAKRGLLIRDRNSVIL